MKRGLRALALLLASLVGCVEPQETLGLQAFPGLGYQVGDRLSPRLYLADDGTLFFNSTEWNDTKFGPCEFRVAMDGKLRCLPDVAVQTVEWFADTMCSQPIYLKVVDACNEPMGEYVLVRHLPAFESCQTDIRYSVHKVEKKPLALAAAFQLQNGTCVQAKLLQSPDDGEVHLIDGDVAPGELVGAWK